MIFRSTLSLAAVLFVGSVMADDLRSGPQVGATNNRNGFFPQFVAGPSAGQSFCPV